jgi:hypothetical protein
MSNVIVIGDAEKAALRDAYEWAKAHPLTLQQVMAMATPHQETDTVTLAERDAVEARHPQASDYQRMVELPPGYRVNISCEEQPAGMCLHLSISTPTPDRSVPDPAKVAFVLDALGLSAAEPSPMRQWVEDFLIDGKRAGRAVNVVLVLAPAQGGRA